MKEIVGVIDTIAVPAPKVWEVIAAIGGVDKWASMITSCRVEGGGPGAKRFCTMADGTDLEEVVEEVDHGAMRFRYRIVRGLPVESYQGTIEIRAAGNAHSEITWYSAYAASEEIAEGFRFCTRHCSPVLGRVEDLPKCNLTLRSSQFSLGLSYNTEVLCPYCTTKLSSMHPSKECSAY